MLHHAGGHGGDKLLLVPTSGGAPKKSILGRSVFVGITGWPLPKLEPERPLSPLRATHPHTLPPIKVFASVLWS